MPKRQPSQDLGGLSREILTDCRRSCKSGAFWAVPAFPEMAHPFRRYPQTSSRLCRLSNPRGGEPSTAAVPLNTKTFARHNDATQIRNRSAIMTASRNVTSSHFTSLHLSLRKIQFPPSQVGDPQIGRIPRDLSSWQTGNAKVVESDVSTDKELLSSNLTGGRN